MHQGTKDYGEEEASDDCDGDGMESASSDGDDDDGILFQRPSGHLGGTRSRGAGGIPPEEDPPSLSPLNAVLIQPGAVMQCFEASVAAHDDPSPAASAPWWTAPPTTTAAAAIAGEPTSAGRSSSSSAAILGDWKPRVLPLPDWMQQDQDVEREEDGAGALRRSGGEG
jgi:hypothetical protein